MTVLGGLCLWLAFLLGMWGAVTGFAGGHLVRADLQASSRRAVYAMYGSLLTAVFALEWALFHHDFNVEYVAAYTSRNLPIFYTWSALYAGQKGSLLFWATVLSLFGSLAMLLTARRHHALLPYVAGVVCTVATFFISVMLFGQANPFHRLAYTPLDGNGLNPQLQNPGMVFHPPMLYLGYISITIPYAFAMAALLSRRLDTDWLVAIRKWTLVSWLFLSIGLLLGMWWAYVELGWGGYWAWDPVENAALMPWLTATAFHHRVEEGGSGEPGHQGGVLDGIPGPVPAPSQFDVSPVASEKQADPQEEPGEEGPAAGGPDPDIPDAARKQCRHPKGVRHGNTDIPKVKARGVNRHEGCLELRVQPLAVGRREGELREGIAGVVEEDEKEEGDPAERRHHERHQ